MKSGGFTKSFNEFSIKTFNSLDKRVIGKFNSMEISTLSFAIRIDFIFLSFMNSFL